MRLPVLVAVAVATVRIASAQTTTDGGLAPERALPAKTLLAIGTDDLEELLKQAGSSPVGRIFKEEEVKAFLEKPIGLARQQLDAGLAKVRENPAFAGAELDPAKLLAGPFGTAFFAITDLSLPDAAPATPESLELGIVIGLQPKAGAVDLLATLEHSLVSIIQSNKAPDVTVETIEAAGLSYERIRSPQTRMAICFASVGGVSLLATSERALLETAACIKSGAGSLATDADFTRCSEIVGARAHGDVCSFVRTGGLLEKVQQIAMLALESSGKADEIAMAEKVITLLHLESFGASCSRSAWRDGTCIKTSYAEVDPQAGGIGALAGHDVPVDRDVLRFIPKEAVSFSISSIDMTAVWDMAIAGLKEVAPPIHEQLTKKLADLETQIAGADAAGLPNWDVRRDLIGALKGRMVTMSVPGVGTMLGPGNDMLGWIETPNPAGLESSFAYLTQLLSAAAQKPVKFKEVVYGDVKLHVLDTMSLGSAAAFAQSLQLTYALSGDRLYFGTTTKAVKKALDAQKTPPTANITARADFANRMVEPPEGAVLTSLSYSDTAVQVEGTYNALVGGLSMLQTMAGTQAGFEMPIDMNLLPVGETISQHLFGTVEMSYRVGERGHVTISRGPFGPETTIGAGVAVAAIAGGAAAVSANKNMAAAREMAHPAEPVPAMTDDARVTKANADLDSLRKYVTIYTISFGELPAALSDLTKSSQDLPKGAADGAAITDDPWDHAYHFKVAGTSGYRIWSSGPNGVDENGGGDDLSRTKE